ncbi:MAG: type III pantothenate kinase [Deltaproteobacteria bacterium]|nr:type III pantothenate kinase [Deltaproteobacteria bacterium]
MLLAIDIGNTNIVIGVLTDGVLLKHWRLSTDKRRTADEYGLLLKSLFSSAGDAMEINGAIIASVVPSLTPVFKEALPGYIGVEPLVVGESVTPSMPVLTDNPSEVGSDRIVNAVAAYSVFKTALIVVDFGTAVTFDYVTERGEYAGGLIAPGISISAEALYKKTAKLPRVDVGRPSTVVGKNTVESMRSGIYWGFVGLVDGIIERMINEVGGSPGIIATGGLAPLVIGGSSYVTESDEFLTLKGLRIIYEGKR